MRQIEVSREFLDEFDNLKDMYTSLYAALREVAGWEGIDHYTNIYQRIFTDYLDVNDKNQNEFAEVWVGKAEYVAKEQLYYVHLIDNETGYLNYRKRFDDYTLQTKEETVNVKTKFTEKEIKDIDPAFWNESFLVNVEGE